MPSSTATSTRRLPWPLLSRRRATDDDSSQQQEQRPAPTLQEEQGTSSPSQSDQCLPVIQKFRLKWVETEREECAVCTVPFTPECIVSLLPCGHYFCQTCIDQWIQSSCRKANCPLCRKDLFKKDEARSLDLMGTNEKIQYVSHENCPADEDEVQYMTRMLLQASPDLSSFTIESKDSRTDSVFGTNFHLIMSKALHARRAVKSGRCDSSQDLRELLGDDAEDAATASDAKEGSNHTSTTRGFASDSGDDTSEEGEGDFHEDEICMQMFY